MDIKGDRKNIFASSKLSFRTFLMYSAANRATLSCRHRVLGRRRSLVEADQVRQQLVGPLRAGRQLPPQAKSEVKPAPFADSGFHQGAEFHPRIVLKRIDHRNQVDIPLVLFAEEIEAAFLHPSGPRCGSDPVWEI